MSDQSKPDETESGSKDGQPMFSRRSFLGVGVVGLTSATGLAFAQQNGTNTTNGTGSGGREGKSDSQSPSGSGSNGPESENDGENDKSEQRDQNSSESEKDGGNDKNKRGEQHDDSEPKNTDENIDKNELKPSQVSLSGQQARNAATNRVGGTVQSVDLGNQNGTPAYEIFVKTNSGSTKEVAVNANTGNVLNVGSQD